MKNKERRGKLKEWLKNNGKETLGKGLDLLGENTSIPILSNLIEGVGESLMKDVDLSPEQKLEVAEIIQLELEELKIMMADTANARDMNVKIQESDKSSWLSKNTAYVLDIAVITILAVLVFMYAFLELNDAQEKLAALGIGIFGTLATQIMHFHRGSSQGSKDKTNILNN